LECSKEKVSAPISPWNIKHFAKDLWELTANNKNNVSMPFSWHFSLFLLLSPETALQSVISLNNASL